MPILAGLATGERPGPAALLGIAVALASVVLITREGPTDPDATHRASADVVGASLLAGALFGLFFGVMALAGVRPVILAEVDDMAMLRLLARESAALALVPPIVVQDELRSGFLVEQHRFEEVFESFYAVVQERRFPHPLVGELLE